MLMASQQMVMIGEEWGERVFPREICSLAVVSGQWLGASAAPGHRSLVRQRANGRCWGNDPEKTISSLSSQEVEEEEEEEEKEKEKEKKYKRRKNQMVSDTFCRVKHWRFSVQLHIRPLIQSLL